jgi:hypothetical protein
LEAPVQRHCRPGLDPAIIPAIHVVMLQKPSPCSGVHECNLLQRQGFQSLGKTFQSFDALNGVDGRDNPRIKSGIKSGDGHDATSKRSESNCL